jgi:hypothetical protein
MKVRCCHESNFDGAGLVGLRTGAAYYREVTLSFVGPITLTLPRVEVGEDRVVQSTSRLSSPPASSTFSEDFAMDRSGIIDIIKSLLIIIVHSWQLTLLAALLILKKSVENLLSRITSLKWKAVEIRFDKQLLPPPICINTTISPPCGVLRINVFDTVHLGGTATGFPVG